MLLDLLDDITFGGCREAGDGRRRNSLLRRHFTDKARNIQIVRPERVSPAGETVRFVEYPAADLTLPDHLPERDIAQLLRGDIQDGDITKTNPLKHITAFRRCEHAV